MTEDRVPEEGGSNRRRDARLVLIGVAGVLLIWFALANLRRVQIEFWVTSARAPLIVVILIAGALGALVTGTVSWYAGRRRGEDSEGKD